MAQDWDIKSRSRVCTVTGQPFEDGQVIYTSLKLGPEGYERTDVAESAWNEELHNQALSTWKSVYHAPPPPTAEPLKKETAETLLRQFISREDDAKVAVMFILAVMLERKRELIERDVQEREDGTRLRIYEHRKTGEMFALVDPDLRLDDLSTVQQEVRELLGLADAAQPDTPEVPPEKTPDTHPQSD
ncbi:MAG: hypothetical protein KDL31_07110 [Kiritimatiellae bacterium]|nr:hypothetical protein [Kiritimatiellia bacterium]